jgi:hypothetical protein
VTQALLRVSTQPSGIRSSRSVGRRRPVMAWGIFREDGAHTSTVGMIARGVAALEELQPEAQA